MRSRVRRSPACLARRRTAPLITKCIMVWEQVDSLGTRCHHGQRDHTEGPMVNTMSRAESSAAAVLPIRVLGCDRLATA